MSTTKEAVSTHKSEQFVGRSLELNAFSDFLHKIQEGQKPKSNIFEYCGPPGIGKSSLVQQEMQVIKQFNELSPYPDIHTAFIDFADTALQSQYAQDPVLLVADLTAQATSTSSGYDTGELNSAIQRYEAIKKPTDILKAYHNLSAENKTMDKPDWFEAQFNVIVEFLKLLQTNKSPIVIFFDNINTLSPELSSWVEENLVNAAVNIKQVGCVYTSDRPFWNALPNKRRITSRELPPLPRSETTKQIAVGSLHESQVSFFVDTIQNLTAGHPAANKVAIDTIDRAITEGRAPLLQPENTTHLKRLIAHNVFNEVVENEAFASLTLEEKENAYNLSQVRIIGPSAINMLLQVTTPDQYKDMNSADGLDMIRLLMKKIRLVSPKGYAVDPLISHLIQKHYLYNKPEVFFQLQEVASGIYKSWIEKNPDQTPQFIEELLWHQAMLGLSGKRVNLADTLAEQIEVLKKNTTDPQARHEKLVQVNEGMQRLSVDLTRFDPEAFSSLFIPTVEV